MVSTRGVIKWTLLCVLLSVFFYDGLCYKEKPPHHRRRRSWLENLLGNALTSLNNGTDVSKEYPSLTTTQLNTSAISQSAKENSLLLLNITSTAVNLQNASGFDNKGTQNTEETKNFNIDSLLGNFLQDLIKKPADDSKTLVETPSPSATPSAPAETAPPVNISDILGQLFSGLQNELPKENSSNSEADQNVPSISTTSSTTTEYPTTKHSSSATGISGSNDINLNISSLLGGLILELQSSDKITKTTTAVDQTDSVSTTASPGSPFDLKSILEGLANSLKTTPRTSVFPTTSGTIMSNKYTTASLKNQDIPPPAGSLLQEAEETGNLPNTTDQQTDSVSTTASPGSPFDLKSILDGLANSLKTTPRTSVFPTTSGTIMSNKYTTASLKNQDIPPPAGSLLQEAEETGNLPNTTDQQTDSVSTTASPGSPFDLKAILEGLANSLKTTPRTTVIPTTSGTIMSNMYTTASLNNQDIPPPDGSLLQEAEETGNLPNTTDQQTDSVSTTASPGSPFDLKSILEGLANSLKTTPRTTEIPTTSGTIMSNMYTDLPNTTDQISTTTSVNILQSNDIFSILGKLLNSSVNVEPNISTSVATDSPERPSTTQNDILGGNILNNLLDQLILINNTQPIATTVSVTSSKIPPSSTLQPTSTSTQKIAVNDNYFNDILKGILDLTYGDNTTLRDTTTSASEPNTFAATTTASVLSGNDLAGILDQILNDIGSSGTEINYTESQSSINITTFRSNKNPYTITTTTQSTFGQIDFEKIFGNIFSNLTTEKYPGTSIDSQLKSTQPASTVDQSFQPTDVTTQQSLPQNLTNPQSASTSLNSTTTGIIETNATHSERSTAGTAKQTTFTVTSASTADIRVPTTTSSTKDLSSSQLTTLKMPMDTTKTHSSMLTTSTTATTPQPRSTDSTVLPSPSTIKSTMSVSTTPTFLSPISLPVTTDTTAQIETSSREVVETSPKTSSATSTSTSLVPAPSTTTADETTTQNTEKPSTATSTTSPANSFTVSTSGVATNSLSKTSTLPAPNLTETSTEVNALERSTTLAKSSKVITTSAVPQPTTSTTTVRSTILSTIISSSVTTKGSSRLATPITSISPSPRNQDFTQNSGTRRPQVDQTGNSVRQESVQDVKSRATTIRKWDNLAVSLILILAASFMCCKR